MQALAGIVGWGNTRLVTLNHARNGIVSPAWAETSRTGTRIRSSNTAGKRRDDKFMAGIRRLRRVSNQIPPWLPAERMLLPTGLSAGLTQSIQETLSNAVVPKDCFPAIPPIHDVVDRARILDSQLARHPRRRPGEDTFCPLAGLTPFQAAFCLACIVQCIDTQRTDAVFGSLPRRWGSPGVSHSPLRTISSRRTATTQRRANVP